MTIFHAIKPGAIVTTVDRFGKSRRGRAVMFNREVGCWVLNMGGRHGTPGIATEENVTAVTIPKSDGFTRTAAIINGRGA